MSALPVPLAQWFATRGWQMHPHQRVMLDRADDPATLLIAPTGGGKTLAGFLPTLADLATGDHAGLHTLHISPLKALAADIRRNLTTPVTEMGSASASRTAPATPPRMSSAASAPPASSA